MSRGSRYGSSARHALVAAYDFAEAVVHAVEGEDEIWLVETGPTRRLYVWERVG